MIVSGAVWGESTFVRFEVDQLPMQDIGDSVVVAGVSPAGYNGTFTLLGKSPGGLVVVIPSDPGPYVSGGTVT